MKNWVFMILIVTAGFGLTGCTGDGEQTADDPNPELNGEGGQSASGSEGQPVSVADLKDEDCVKHTVNITCAGRVAGPVVGTSPTVTGYLYYVTYKTPKHQTACLQKSSMNSVYNFLPSDGSPCHSPDDRCLKVKEAWVKKHKDNKFTCREE